VNTSIAASATAIYQNDPVKMLDTGTIGVAAAADVPGLNALFGLEYKRYENQHAEIFDTENSDRAFEEEVMLSGFANAQVKPEGSGVTFDNAQETFTARYSHETIALAFAITEEAIDV
jgi:hypothetical protein